MRESPVVKRLAIAVMFCFAAVAFSQTASKPTPTGAATPTAADSSTPTEKAVGTPAVHHTVHHVTHHAVHSAVKTGATPEATPSPTTVSGPNAQALEAAGDQAMEGKDYAQAVARYEAALKAGPSDTGSESPKSKATKSRAADPQALLTKKLFRAKYLEGQAMVAEAQAGLKKVLKTLPHDGESHNLAVYGKRKPSRAARPFTLSFAFLTPQILGGDVGLTLFAHWNVGLGISPLGLDPRFKYYFSGDGGSFFLGFGSARYGYTLSKSVGNNNGNGNGGSGTGSIDGHFIHFTFGPSYQGAGGFFMELPFDVGTAKLHFSGKANGNSNGGSGSTSGETDYNGIMGSLGFRIGFSI